MKKENTVTCPVRMTSALQGKAKDASAKLGLSLSAYIRQLISKDVNGQTV